MLRLFVLISFVLLVSPLFGQLNELEIIGKPEKLTTEFVSLRDANGKICAAIQVISDREGFKYDANNGVVKVDDQPGKDIVYLQPSERVMEIFLNGYKPLKVILSDFSIQLKEKEVWKIEINCEVNTIDLLPVTMLVQPSDAIITIDGRKELLGQPIKLSRGNHNVNIIKQGYQTLNEIISVSEKNVLFNFNLKEVQLEAVVIRSNPGDAQVYLDGNYKGTTGMEGKPLFLFPGIYQIKLLKPGYMEINHTLNVTTGIDNTFEYSLEKNSGILELNILPMDAILFINKENYSGRNKIDLPPGQYKIEVSKTGYQSQTELLSITRNQTIIKNYILKAITGQLQFTIQPLSAQVTLKSGDRTIANWQGMKILDNLPVGDYDIEVKASGYATQTNHITIVEGQTLPVDIQLSEDKKRFVQVVNSGTVTDIDGNVYKTVQIGEQIWMAENLRVTRFRNGVLIPNVINASEWKNLTTAAYCNYDNNIENVREYGRLYNWYAVYDSHNIAPKGWHVPTDEEWKRLESYIGKNAGEKMKKNENNIWQNSDQEASNSSGFSALPGGYRSSSGSFFGLRHDASFWTATESNSGRVWYRTLYYSNSNIKRGYSNKLSGFYIRLVKD